MTNWIRAIALGISLAISGCADQLGPRPMLVTKVSGRVTLRGRPVSRGWIEFLPVAGTIGRMTTAAIQPDGTFSRDVPVGILGLRPVGVRPESPEGDLLGKRFAIRRQTRADGATQMDIDLTLEATRLSATGTPR